jgi:hypothetical protein
MRKVLTTQSTVTCGHIPPTPGTVQTESSAKLKVDGHPVLLESSVVGKRVVGCGTVPPPASNARCAKVNTVENTPPPKLTVDGSSVLVDTIKGATEGQVGGVKPQRLLSATANQSKLLTT